MESKKKKIETIIFYTSIILIFVLSIAYRLTMETNLGFKSPGYVNQAANIIVNQAGPRFAILPEYTTEDEQNQRVNIQKYLKKLFEQEQIKYFMFVDINIKNYENLSKLFPQKIINIQSAGCNYFKVDNNYILLNNQKEPCEEYQAYKFYEETLENKTNNFEEELENIKSPYNNVEDFKKNDNNKFAIKLVNENVAEQDVFYNVLINKSRVAEKTKVTTQANKDFYEINGLGNLDFKNNNSLYQVSKFQIINKNLQKYDEKILILAEEESKVVSLLEI